MFFLYVNARQWEVYLKVKNFLKLKQPLKKSRGLAQNVPLTPIFKALCTRCNLEASLNSPPSPSPSSSPTPPLHPPDAPLYWRQHATRKHIIPHEQLRFTIITTAAMQSAVHYGSALKQCISAVYYGSALKQCISAVHYSSAFQQSTTAMHYSSALQQCTTAVQCNANGQSWPCQHVQFKMLLTPNQSF